MDQTNYLWQAAYMAAVYESLAAIEQRLVAQSEIDNEELKAIQNAQDASRHSKLNAWPTCNIRARSAILIRTIVSLTSQSINLGFWQRPRLS
jgi:hypothetical protein